MAEKIEVKKCLEEFCRAKEEENKVDMEKAVKRLFSYELIMRLVRHGAPNRSYGFYGAKKLAFIYKNVSREQWLQTIAERTEKVFIRDFAIDINNVDSETTARKMVNSFMAMNTRHEVATYTVELAKKRYPNVSTHYLTRYIKMRKNGLELDDYDWRQEESIEKMMEDTGMSMPTCYHMFYAFDETLTKEDVDTERRKAIDAKLGIKNHSCKESNRKKVKSLTKNGIDVTKYDIADPDSLERMSRDTGYRVSTCAALLADIGLTESHSPKTDELTFFDVEDFEE